MGLPNKFPISRDPPEGGTFVAFSFYIPVSRFPISRDPPEGGTSTLEATMSLINKMFPISRDPPEGGTRYSHNGR